MQLKSKQNGLPATHMPVQLVPFLFAEAMHLLASGKFIVVKPLGQMNCPLLQKSRSCCSAPGRLWSHEQGVFFLSLSFEEDGNVILRARFKFSGIDLQY